jgi:DUF4097 and DUF4098 domain-containing protein YvlB
MTFTALALFLCLQDVVKEQDFEFEKDPAISVRAVVGTVRVRGSDGKKARLKAVVRGPDRDQVEIRIDATKDRLDIEERYADGRGRNVDVEVSIDLELPRALKSLKLAGVSGRLEAEDLKAPEFRLTNVSGDVRLARAAGDITLSTVSGDLRLEEASGKKVSLSATSGDFTARGSFETIELSTVSGDGTLELTPPKEGSWRLDASTISGDLSIRLPDTAGARVTATTLSGDLKCAFALKDEKRERDGARKLTGTFGDGTGSIAAKSISGSVAIEKTGK